MASRHRDSHRRDCGDAQRKGFFRVVSDSSAELVGGERRRYFSNMNTLAEVEAAVPQLSVKELAELERFVRETRFKKTQGSGRSPLDLPPLDLGRQLKPLGTRDEWYDEMLEGRV